MFTLRLLAEEAERAENKDWKVLRGKYKRFIKENRRKVVERWYNKLAQPQQKREFRFLVKSILLVPEETELPRATHDPAAHLARVIYQHYAQSVIAPNCKSQVLWWFYTVPTQQQDIFRNIMTALDRAVRDAAPPTAFQDEFPEYEQHPTEDPEEAKRRRNMTFLSQMSAVRELLRQRGGRTEAATWEREDPEGKLSVGEMLTHLDKMQKYEQSLAQAGSGQRPTSLPAAFRVPSSTVGSNVGSSASRSSRGKGSQVGRQPPVETCSNSLIATLPKGRAIVAQNRPTTTTLKASGSDVSSASLDRKRDKDRGHSGGSGGGAASSGLAASVGGYATTEDGFLVPGIWDTAAHNVRDGTFKSRRVATTWHVGVGYKTAMLKEPNNLLSRPARRTVDVKTPWSGMTVGMERTTTTNLDTYKYIPQVMSEKFNNDDVADDHRIACNPKFTASVGCTVPPLIH